MLQVIISVIRTCNLLTLCSFLLLGTAASAHSKTCSAIARGRWNHSSLWRAANSSWLWRAFHRWSDQAKSFCRYLSQTSREANSHCDSKSPGARKGLSRTWPGAEQNAQLCSWGQNHRSVGPPCSTFWYLLTISEPTLNDSMVLGAAVIMMTPRPSSPQIPFNSFRPKQKQYTCPPNLPWPRSPNGITNTKTRILPAGYRSKQTRK